MQAMTLPLCLDQLKTSIKPNPCPAGKMSSAGPRHEVGEDAGQDVFQR